MTSVGGVRQKSYTFSLAVVHAVKGLQDQKGFVMSKQLLRSGTSIGANIEEATAAQSRADFISKMCIASKEARETQYWLRLLADSGYFQRKESYVLRTHCLELVRMLTAIVKTSQRRPSRTATKN